MTTDEHTGVHLDEFDGIATLSIEGAWIPAPYQVRGDVLLWESLGLRTLFLPG